MITYYCVTKSYRVFNIWSQLIIKHFNKEYVYINKNNNCFIVYIDNTPIVTSKRISKENDLHGIKFNYCDSIFIDNNLIDTDLQLLEDIKNRNQGRGSIEWIKI